MPRLRAKTACDPLLHFFLGVSVFAPTFADTDNCNEVVLLQGSHHVVKVPRKHPSESFGSKLHHLPMVDAHDVDTPPPDVKRFHTRSNIMLRDRRSSNDFDVCEWIGRHGHCSMHSCLDDRIVVPSGLISRSTPDALPVVNDKDYRSHCAISHKHQFIFVPILRNAGTATKAWLDRALCGEAQKCDPDVLQLGACHPLMTNYSNYFRWSWKRPIYDRAASIYNMAKNYNMADNVSFADFWLAGSDRWLLTDLTPDHAWPQTAFLRNRKSCSAVDFLGSLTNVDTDMKKLLEKLGVPELSDFYATHGFSKPSHNTTQTTGLDFVTRNPAAYPALKKMLAKEFEKDFGWCGIS